MNYEYLFGSFCELYMTATINHFHGGMSIELFFLFFLTEDEWYVAKFICI